MKRDAQWRLAYDTLARELRPLCLRCTTEAVRGERDYARTTALVRLVNGVLYLSLLRGPGFRESSKPLKNCNKQTLSVLCEMRWEITGEEKHPLELLATEGE